MSWLKVSKYKVISTLEYSLVQWSTKKYNLVQYKNAIQHSLDRYSRQIQYNTIPKEQYSFVLYKTDKYHTF